jgi:hypothetical protein
VFLLSPPLKHAVSLFGGIRKKFSPHSAATVSSAGSFSLRQQAEAVLGLFLVVRSTALLVAYISAGPPNSTSLVLCTS